jgi:hypothetical protein
MDGCDLMIGKTRQHALCSERARCVTHRPQVLLQQLEADGVHVGRGDGLRVADRQGGVLVGVRRRRVRAVYELPAVDGALRLAVGGCWLSRDGGGLVRGGVAVRRWLRGG